MTIISIKSVQRGPAVYAGQPVVSAAVITAPYAPQGPRIYGTASNSPNDIDLISPKTFLLNEWGLSFQPGVRLRASAVDTPTDFVEGVVISYTTNTKTLVLDVD